MERIIKNYRAVKKCNDGVNRTEKRNQREDFRIILGLKENSIYESKEYSIVKNIKKIFPNEIINEQYRIKKHFIDLVSLVQKLRIEIDENEHLDRSKSEEKKRENNKRKNRVRDY